MSWISSIIYLAPSGELKFRPSKAEFIDIPHISKYCSVRIELAYTWTQRVSLRASVGLQILIHVSMHLHLLWTSDSLMLLSMLAILLTDLHNTYNFILLLFSPNSLLLCIIPFILQACLTDLPSSHDLHTSAPPVASATLILLLPSFLPRWKKKIFYFWLRFWLLFLFKLARFL